MDNNYEEQLEIEEVEYNQWGNMECKNCGSESFIYCDKNGNASEKEESTIRCCNCGKVYYI